MRTKTKRIAVCLSIVMMLSTFLAVMTVSAFAYDDCDHENAIYTAASEASCFEPGTEAYWFCEDCWQYLDANKNVFDPEIYWDEIDILTALRKKATGHSFNKITGACDECGISTPVYSKVTSLDAVNEEDMYIIVAEVGDRRFVLGGLDESNPDDQNNVWCNENVGNAILVTPNSDGTICLANQNFANGFVPSEFMFDIDPDQFNSDLDDNFGLTPIIPKLPNHCIYPFQSSSLANNGYMGVPRYANDVYGMWDSSEWIIDFYTEEVDENTYRDDMDGLTHAEQLERGNIDENVKEGDLIIYKASFYAVGGAMFTMRFREYVNEGGITEYYFICDEDWRLEGSSGWDYITDTTPTNDTQYAISLYRYDVIHTSVHTCTFGNWYDAEDGNHRRDCQDPACEEFETGVHAFPATWTKLDARYHTHECNTVGCDATEKVNHTFGEWGEYAGFDGITRHCTASGCSAYETQGEEPPIHTCSFGEWMPDPENDMKHVRKCECGAIESADHSFGDWTHKDDHFHTHTCPICGATEDFEHSFNDWIAKDDDDHIHQCMECVYNSVLPHDYVSEVTKEPTATENGEVTYTCSLCSHFYTEELPKRIFAVENETVDVVINVPEQGSAYIPEGTVIDVVEVAEEEISLEIVGEIELQIDGGVKPLACYDLSLLLDGAEIQPDGKILVTLPALQFEYDYDSVVVVYIAPDGSVEKCHTIVNEDGTITFETDHFSRYAVIGVTDERGPSIGLIVGIVIGSLAVVAIGGFAVYWFVIKKKNWAELVAIFQKEKSNESESSID